jgi:hypothetical protein
MGKIRKIISIFIISFIISYFIVGFVANNVFVLIHWEESATAWDKFKEYYIRTASINVIPALILSLLSTTIIVCIKKVMNVMSK